RDVATIRDLSHYQYATIIGKSAFAASDGESRLKPRGDKKLYDAIPPLLPSAAAATVQARPTEATWTRTRLQSCWTYMLLLGEGGDLSQGQTVGRKVT
ncbi:MAG TPA: hypothetical protein VLW86_00105, partial [Syntrophorhabdales bacterium]|nr:hypothetical protein [Syntrophorhabdales bacterium]